MDDGYIYIVKIPRSNNAPHMALDHKYYKRFNFSSEPMEEYEVRDLFQRISIPDLEISGCSFYKKEESEHEVTFHLLAGIVNHGHQVCESYKLNFYINNPDAFKAISYRVHEANNSYTLLGKNQIKLGSTSKEPIFPGEELNLGHFDIIVEKEKSQRFVDCLVVDMVLFYSHESKEVAYPPSIGSFINDSEEIKRTIKEKCKVFKSIKD